MPDGAELAEDGIYHKISLKQSFVLCFFIAKKIYQGILVNIMKILPVINLSKNYHLEKHKSLNNTRPIPLNIAIRGYMTGGGNPSCAAEDTQPGSEKVFGRNFCRLCKFIVQKNTAS